MRCSLLYSRDFSELTNLIFPCELLQADICFGTYYCSCENGFWQEAFSISKRSKIEVPVPEPTQTEESGKESVEFNVLKGALIAGLVATVVCTIPCIVLVVYFRRRRMNAEVQLSKSVTASGNFDQEIWSDLHNAG